MTVIVAGPGFGKSVLLVQAVDENALAPRGIDCWLGWGPGDDYARRLAAGLADALGADLPEVHQPGELDPYALGALLAGDLWRLSPRHVCLVLDDVHEVGRSSPGATVLTGLVEGLLANGHVVLSGRTEPPLALARLSAQGQVESLRERDLAFGEDELAEFAALRGLPRERLADLGGWPALAELRTAGARTSIDDFLAEEVMAALSEGDRRVVATVAALGGADQRLIDVVLGDDIHLGALMARLPLVTCDEQGWYAIHPVWSDSLSEQLDPRERREVQRRAGLALATRDLRHATDLLVAAGAHDELRAMLRTGTRAHVLSAFSGVGRLYATLPEPVRASPEGLLVAGVAASTTDVDRAIELLSAAAERLAEDGEYLGLLAAIEHLAMYAHWREDVELFGRLWGYAHRLEGLPDARGVIAIGHALIADTLGDARGVLAALDSIDDDEVAVYWRASVTWLRAGAELALGFAEAARRHAELAVAQASPALRGALTILEVNAHELCGDTDRAGEALQRMLVELERSATTTPAPSASAWPRPGPPSRAVWRPPTSTSCCPASTAARIRCPASRPRCGSPTRPSPWPRATRWRRPGCWPPRSTAGRCRRAASTTTTCAACRCSTCWSRRPGSSSRRWTSGPATAPPCRWPRPWWRCVSAATWCRRRRCEARTGRPRGASSPWRGPSSWPPRPRPAASRGPRPGWPTRGRWPAPRWAGSASGRGHPRRSGPGPARCWTPSRPSRPPRWSCRSWVPPHCAGRAGSWTTRTGAGSGCGRCCSCCWPGAAAPARSWRAPCGLTSPPPRRCATCGSRCRTC
jgi:hypothetical protein